MSKLMVATDCRRTLAMGFSSFFLTILVPLGRPAGCPGNPEICFSCY